MTLVAISTLWRLQIDLRLWFLDIVKDPHSVIFPERFA